MNAVFRTAAARHAALKLLIGALQQLVRETTLETLEDYDRDGTDRWRTGHGTVHIVERQTPIVADERAFLQWVKDNRPEEIEERIRPGSKTNLLRATQVVGDNVILRGEILDFLRPPQGRYVRYVPSGEVEEAVEEMVRAHLEEIARYTVVPEIESGRG